MEIGIIGAGNIGSTLAKYLVNLGHQVLISNSRGPESIFKVVEETGAIAVNTEESARAKDIVIISIPEKAISNLPSSILSNSNAIIIDTGNYYPSRDGKNVDIENGLTDSEWVAKTLGHSVIKAFNNIVASSLATKAIPLGDSNRIALSVAGNDETAKQTVIELINKIGFDTVDAGLLSESWRQQPGEPAYCQDFDKDQLRLALEKADLSKREENLAFADEMARPYF